MFAAFGVDSNKSREHDFTTIALIVSIVLMAVMQVQNPIIVTIIKIL